MIKSAGNCKYPYVIFIFRTWSLWLLCGNNSHRKDFSSSSLISGSLAYLQMAMMMRSYHKNPGELVLSGEDFAIA